MIMFFYNQMAAGAGPPGTAVSKLLCCNTIKVCACACACVNAIQLYQFILCR